MRVPLAIALFAAALALPSSTRPAASRSPQPSPDPPPRRLALLVGINQYRAVSNLRGCINDVMRMKALLVGRFDFAEADIVVLTNQQATHQAIVDALGRLAARAQPGDIVVVHYSGHGSRMEDASGDELDGLDETLVAHDSRTGQVRDVSDDEINAFLQQIAAKTPNVTLILDSCHSGSATRGGAEARRAADDVRPLAVARPAIARVAEGVHDFRPSGASYVLISGSRPHELSNEFDVDGQRVGALTYYLTQEMAEASPDATYRDVVERVREHVTARFPSQHPDVEGAADRVMLGDAQALPQPYVIVNPASGRTVRIAAGTVFGLTDGSELDVYPPGAREFRDPAARAGRIAVTRADAHEAEATIVAGGPIRNASRAVVRSRRYPDERLRVQFVEDPRATVLPAVRARLHEYPFLSIAADETAADLRLREEGGSIYTESADLVQLSPAFAASEAGAVDRTLERLAAWAKWFAILRLRNPDGGLPIRLTVGTGPRYSDGDRVAVVVENLSRQNVYVTLLDLQVDGAITPLTSADAMNDYVPPGGVKRQLIQVGVPGGRAWVPDVIKAIVTTVPLDAAWFSQAAPRAADPVTLPSDPLARLIAQTALGRSRDARPVAASDWAAAERRIETHAPGRTPTTQPAGLPDAPRLDGFIAHFPDGTRADPAAMAARGLPACGAGPQPGTCWDIEPLGPGVDAAEIRPGGRRAASRAPVSMGAAWEQAYALQQQTGAAFVEPIFEVTVEAEDPSRSGGAPQAPAPDDREWSLKYVDAPGAVAYLRTLNKPAGREAEGIVFGHPDTGYREHPEIWDADEARSPVLFRKGWNFVENNDVPLDTLADSGIVANPGHGTKSSSVIVSPPGKQWSSADAGEFVTGAAPGARLVPLRVHTSVVHLHTGRLAKAILYAAQPDGTHVKLDAPVDVISIAMGGLPSLALYKAVRRAEANGVIVVAAAGNHVRFVVWPARFAQTIAVAAVNSRCLPWSGSSRGDAVDVAAPGEGVWHASVDTAGAYAIKSSDGTTYATATTSGVAALWLARHKGSAEYVRLKNAGRLTDTLRWALQRTAWTPADAAKPAGVSCAADAGWDSKAYGAGIVHAARAVQVPLEEPPTTRSAARGEPEFPVSASLFHPDVAPEEVSRRLRHLLRDVPDADRPTLDVELATVYATDERVREAIDAIAGPADPAEPAYDQARAAIGASDVSTLMRRGVGRA